MNRGTVTGKARNSWYPGVAWTWGAPRLRCLHTGSTAGCPVWEGYGAFWRKYVIKGQALKFLWPYFLFLTTRPGASSTMPSPPWQIFFFFFLEIFLDFFGNIKQNNPFFPNFLCIRVFYHSNGRVTNTDLSYNLLYVPQCTNIELFIKYLKSKTLIHTCNSNTGEVGTGKSELKAILGYGHELETILDKWDPVLKKKLFFKDYCYFTFTYQMGSCWPVFLQHMEERLNYSCT